jgi:hypothetical protein
VRPSCSPAPGPEASDEIQDFIAKEPAEVVSKNLGRLFSQTRKLIESLDAQGKTKEAADQAVTLVALGKQLMAEAKDEARKAALKELVVEMKIKSGDDKLVAEALEEAEAYLKTNAQAGQWQVFKCEALTKMALKAGADDKKWTVAVLEWKKLTEDPDMIKKPENREFYWQSWYYMLAIRLEMAQRDSTNGIYNQVFAARKNLKGIYGDPVEKWRPYFDELDTAIQRKDSVLRR